MSRAALSMIVGVLVAPGLGARQAAPVPPPPPAVSAIPPDDEIRGILVKRIDTDKQSVGIVVRRPRAEGAQAGHLRTPGEG